MAIQVYCVTCRTSTALTSKSCPKCGVVFTRDNRKYRVSVSVKGKRVNRIVDNLTIAREAESAIKGDMVRGEFDITAHRATKALTLDDLWKRFLPWAKEHKKTWRTDEYHYGKHLAPRFGNKALDAISVLDIERMKSELRQGLNQHGKPYAAASIKHQLVLLKRLYNIAAKWGLYERPNPVKRVQMPKVDNQKTEFMTEDEVKRLWNALEEWPCRETVAIVKFALLSGLRRGELFKLTWDDVDFQRGIVTLRDPKGGKTKTIPLSSEALQVLRDVEINSTLVFPGNDGKQRTDFKGPWQRIRKAAGLPEDFRFHGLRHHFASTLVSNGIDLAVVRELLTHKDMSTTQRYAHLMPDAIKAAALTSGTLLSPRSDQDH
ncbi:MAG: tyrosine-type recombinase/integrase [Syntrophobacteraceae bacterium]